MPQKQSKTAKPQPAGSPNAGGAAGSAAPASTGAAGGAQATSTAPLSMPGKNQQLAHSKPSQPKLGGAAALAAAAAAAAAAQLDAEGVLEVPRISAMQAKKRKVYQKLLEGSEDKAELRAEFQRYLREKAVVQMLKTGLLRIFIEKPRDAVGAMKNHIAQWNKDQASIVQKYAVNEQAYQEKQLVFSAIDPQAILSELIRASNNEANDSSAAANSQQTKLQNGQNDPNQPLGTGGSQQQPSQQTQLSQPPALAAGERASMSIVTHGGNVPAAGTTGPATAPVATPAVDNNSTAAGGGTAMTGAAVQPLTATAGSAPPVVGNVAGGGNVLQSNAQQQQSAVVRTAAAAPAGVPVTAANTVNNTDALNSPRKLSTVQGTLPLPATAATTNTTTAAASLPVTSLLVPLVDEDTGLLPNEQIQQQQAALETLLATMNNGPFGIAAAGSGTVDSVNKDRQVSGNTLVNGSWLGGEGGMFQREITTYNAIKAYEVRNQVLKELAEKLEKLVTIRTRDLLEALGDGANGAGAGGDDATDASSSGSVEDDQRSSVSRLNKRGGTAAGGAGKSGVASRGAAGGGGGKDTGSNATGLSTATNAAGAAGSGKKGSKASDDKRSTIAGGGSDAQQQQQQHSKDYKPPKASSLAGGSTTTAKKK